jgi:hypothetical protein
LATAVQALLAWYYGVNIQFLLAAAVFLAFCILSIIFEIVFDCTFVKSTLSQERIPMVKAKEKEIADLKQKLNTTREEADRKNIALSITNKEASLKS